MCYTLAVRINVGMDQKMSRGSWKSASGLALQRVLFATSAQVCETGINLEGVV